MDAEASEKFSQLQQALIEGEMSGPSLPFDFDAFIAERLPIFLLPLREKVAAQPPDEGSRRRF